MLQIPLGDITNFVISERGINRRAFGRVVSACILGRILTIAKITITASKVDSHALKAV